LIKGALSLGLALGVYKMTGAGLSDLFDRFVHWVHLDPENRFLSDIGDRLELITPANVRWMATGTFLYSLFALVEGVGLIFRVPWAGWLAIGESAFFIPIEIFELVRHHRSEMLNPSGSELISQPQFGLLIVLAINVFIVWYLYTNRKRLFRHH
jgi:uncharacterized membrane protein (DUF2068 family)